MTDTQGAEKGHVVRNLRRLPPTSASGRVWAACLVLAMVSVLLALPVPALADALRCVPPDVPMTDLPVGILVEYRAEIAAEFEAYFAALSDHIACLDAERARAMEEARVAATAYADLINTFPVTKDLP